MHKSLLACARGYFYEFQTALAAARGALPIFRGAAHVAARRGEFTYVASEISVRIHSHDFRRHARARARPRISHS